MASVEDCIGQGIGNALQDGEVLTSWVAVATLMDEHGDQRIMIATDKSQTASTTLGLLEYASVCERLHVQVCFLSTDE